MSNTEIVQVTTRYDATELWSMIMGAGWEMWGWWIKYEYRGGEWDTPCTLRVTAWGSDEGEDPDEYITTDITIADVVSALTALGGIGMVHADLAKRDFDASSSDCVIQQCVYGEVMYG